MTDPFAAIVRCWLDREVRFLVIGVWGANYYADCGEALFHTLDRDVLLPLEAANLLRVWEACADVGLELRAGAEPLDAPRDLALARAVVERKALTTARDEAGLQIDLTLLMSGFSFDEVWSRRRRFMVDGVPVPVASLRDIITSKGRAGREKDRLFLATYAELLGRMVEADEGEEGA